MSKPANYYDILGVSPDASSQELKKAYRQKAAEHHPDKGGDSKTMQQVNKAWATLGDPILRDDYDCLHRLGKYAKKGAKHSFRKGADAYTAWQEFTKKAKPKAKAQANKPKEPSQEPKAEKKAGSGRVGTGYCPRCGGHGVHPIAMGFKTVQIACAVC